MEKKAGSSGSTGISKSSRTRVTRKSARACQDTCADLPLRKQPAYTLSRQTTPLAKQLTSRLEMPCPVISPSHWRVPPKRLSMQMLHRREHGRLLVQGRAVVYKTKTCAGCEDMSEKR